MVDWALLIACILGGIGLWLIMGRTERPARLLGVVLGLGALAFALAQVTRIGADAVGTGDRPPLLFYGFAVIAVASAVRMITHARPVYCALYFVLVVLSSAAIFLYLEAEFMAFALIIVYAGAILITYLFVLMLAQQAPAADGDEATTPLYDRVPREPAAAVFAGFLLLALLGQLIFASPNELPMHPGSAARRDAVISELNRLDTSRRRVIEHFRAADPDLPFDSAILAVTGESVTFSVPPRDTHETLTYAEAGVEHETIEAILPQNIERVGWALVHEFPVSLELAGIILLMAMFGAVVLSRKQIELSEDEKRLAHGLERLTVDPGESSAPTPEGGAP